ncbi:hypothetical protein K6L09_20700 [Burkholderia cepacia]
MNQLINKQLEKAKNYALSKDGQCISTEYTHARGKLLWKCKNRDHPQWSSSYEKVVLLKRWCPLCGIDKCRNALVNPLGLNSAKAYAEERGGQCLSEQYIDAKSKLKWKCGEPNHPTWEAIYNNVVKKGRWCPLCYKKKRHISENRIRQFFEIYFGKPFPSSTPSWNRNPWTNRPLELDGYCDEFNLAFEHDGEHHFSKKFGYKTKDLAYQKFKDHQKKKNCLAEGVTLINIPIIDEKYRNKFPEFLNHVIHHCTIQGLPMTFTKEQINTLMDCFYQATPRINEAP